MTKEERERLIEQYVVVQHSGVTNMFDYPAVMYYANQANLYSLVVALDRMGSKEYSKFLFSLTEEELDIEPDPEALALLVDEEDMC